MQSMPDVSPAKWHMAHTTWFFETFIVKRWVQGYQPEIPQYAYLFNSYYNAAGDMHRRDLRGLISRPTVEETRRYRASIDSHIDTLLTSADDDLLAELEPILILGIHHEQQHQELMITDIKHVFAQNPLHPIFRDQPTRGLTRSFARSTLSNSRNASSTSVMPAPNFPTITKGRGIAHSFRHFAWPHAWSRTASTLEFIEPRRLPEAGPGFPWAGRR